MTPRDRVTLSSKPHSFKLVTLELTQVESVYRSGSNSMLVGYCHGLRQQFETDVERVKRSRLLASWDISLLIVQKFRRDIE